MLKLNAAELRTTEPTEAQIKSVKRKPIFLVLDNVLDTYNVGSIFRLADAIAAQKVFLCGETLTPPNPRIKKASISTWRWVPWEYYNTAAECLKKLTTHPSTAFGTSNPPAYAKASVGRHLTIIAVEQDPRSRRFDQMKYELPLALVVGNETYGVSKEVLDMADMIVELPMWGINRSLNVMVSLGIVLYQVIGKQ